MQPYKIDAFWQILKENYFLTKRTYKGYLVWFLNRNYENVMFEGKKDHDLPFVVHRPFVVWLPVQGGPDKTVRDNWPVCKSRSGFLCKPIVQIKTINMLRLLNVHIIWMVRSTSWSVARPVLSEPPCTLKTKMTYLWSGT